MSRTNLWKEEQNYGDYGRKKFDIKQEDFHKQSQEILEYIIENSTRVFDRIHATGYITNPKYLEFLYISDENSNVREEAFKQLKRLSEKNHKAGKLYRRFLRQKRQVLWNTNAATITGFFKCFDFENRPKKIQWIAFDKDSPRKNLKHHKKLQWYYGNRQPDIGCIHYFAAPTGKSRWRRWGHGYYQESQVYEWIIIIKRLTRIGDKLYYEYLLTDCERAVQDAESIFTHAL